MSTSQSNSPYTDTDARSSASSPDDATQAGDQHDTREAAKKAPTEADFLAHQANVAMAAFRQSLGDIKTKLAGGLSLNKVVNDHPWLTVAAGAVAGFATGVTLMPSKEDVALRRLAKIEAALNPPAAPTVTADGKVAKAAKPSFAQTMVSEVFGLVRPILLNAMTAGLAAHAVKNSDDKENGATAASSAPPPRSDENVV